ncbi:hypothetical protein SUNI508_06989 [Seiridium unicorne]|uniref:Uncharacterized protein n=1 Tax=Seiridium unicorne TaxID=138068 RepID=A0ABR2UZY9_9PEZI
MSAYSASVISSPPLHHPRQLSSTFSEADTKNGCQSPDRNKKKMQQSTGEESRAAENLRSVLGTLPPVQQWSSATIQSLKSPVNSRDDRTEWLEEPAWTRRVVNIILASEEGWDWRRLKICPNADYFSLPTHTISLLNAMFHTSALDEAKARIEAGDYAAALNLFPVAAGRSGYPSST